MLFIVLVDYDTTKAFVLSSERLNFDLPACICDQACGGALSVKWLVDPAMRFVIAS